MKILARYVLAILIAFILLIGTAGGLHAQSWTPPAAFDTGWHRVNPTQCIPETQEPQVWSPAMLLPLAPDGTDLVRTRISLIEYRTTITCTNVGPEAASYSGAGTFQYRLGHERGLYRGPDWAIYSTGHGWEWRFDQVAWIGSMGGGSFFRTVQPGQTDQRQYQTTGYSSDVRVDPITPEWLTVDRRGAHRLWNTSTGGYSWGWSWTDGTAPAGWSSHSPLSYSAVEETRLTGTVEYGDVDP